MILHYTIVQDLLYHGNEDDLATVLLILWINVPVSSPKPFQVLCPVTELLQ